MVQCHAQAKAFQDRAVWSQPFFPKRDSGVEDRLIGLKERAQRSALVKIDDNIGEGFDASPLWAEDENGLPILD
jgi:hypothetical protein